MGEAKQDNVVLFSVHSTIFKESENLEGKCTKIESYEFNQGLNYHQLLKSMVTTGFQASILGDEIKSDHVRFLVQHHMVDVIVTTAGGIEEDLIKCLAPTYKG
ncbi:hypothetical protein PIB30_014298 [Stylosanthes scabra]|uniref:Deoxyhypusine synthase n=1 Tax=Stylosanthes scabra TaxID=79078 RepID=A0ABU6V9C0_9FABA|nr:hypothetical protein [Stylosanthes scabra]